MPGPLPGPAVSCVWLVSCSHTPRCQPTRPWIGTARPQFVYLDKVVIPGEEAFLGREFGASYDAYMAATPRWINVTTIGNQIAEKLF